jgi:hypothetical protein
MAALRAQLARQNVYLLDRGLLRQQLGSEERLDFGLLARLGLRLYPESKAYVRHPSFRNVGTVVAIHVQDLSC